MNGACFRRIAMPGGVLSLSTSRKCLLGVFGAKKTRRLTWKACWGRRFRSARHVRLTLVQQTSSHIDWYLIAQGTGLSKCDGE